MKQNKEGEGSPTSLISIGLQLKHSVTMHIASTYGLSRHDLTLLDFLWTTSKNRKHTSGKIHRYSHLDWGLTK